MSVIHQDETSDNNQSICPLCQFGAKRLHAHTWAIPIRHDGMSSDLRRPRGGSRTPLFPDLEKYPEDAGTHWVGSAHECWQARSARFSPMWKRLQYGLGGLGRGFLKAATTGQRSRCPNLAGRSKSSQLGRLQIVAVVSCSRSYLVLSN